MSSRPFALCFCLAFPVLLAGQTLLVTEIMADPTPSQGLPQTEYLELYNAGPAAIPLADIAVASGGRATSAGESGQLSPDSYLVLVPEDSLPSWSAFDVVVAGIRFPTLTNTGDEVTVLLRGDTVVHFRYTDDWYRDPTRDDGGYSLEYNGLGALDCSGSWAASRATTGGTPGRPNTVEGTVLDTLPPVVAIDNSAPTGFELLFDEPITTVPDVSFEGAMLVPTYLSSYELSFAVPIEKGRLYTVLVAPDYSDCSGNFADDTARLSLFLPEPLSPGDVLINEILFDPPPGGSDFVELLNNGNVTVQLKGFQLENRASGASSTIEANYYLPVGERVVLTGNTADLLLRFPGARPSAVLQADLPALPNGAGNLTVVSEDGTVIDAFDYREDFHDPLLNPTEGVSLERLDPDRPTQQRDNWYSAATAAGYGTPTLINSQYRRQGEPSTTQFSLPEPTFAPAGTGLPTQLGIHYRTGRPGLQARIKVFDAEGRHVRSLREVSLLGSSGTTYWDGTDDRGQRLPVGPYIILIEVISPDGGSDRHKLVGTLAG